LVLTEAGIATIEIGLMQLLSDNKTDFTKLNNTLKMYLQIRDDYCNLCLQQVTLELLALDG
jgi:geranylgeranyl diphosphate synthase type 3